MKKYLLLFLFVVSSSFLNAQEDSKIVLRNGDTLVGIVQKRGVYGPTIVYRKSKKDAKVKYTYKDVKEIYLEENGSFKKYIYKIVQGTTLDDKIRLLEVVTEGKASLYIHDINTTFRDPSGGFSESLPTYYICLDDNSSVRYLSTGNPKKKKVRTVLVETLNDCKELVQKINGKMFKYGELREIVEYYNSNCASK